MSERDDDSSGCVAYLVVTIAAAVVLVMLLNRLDRQDDWIRDLQQRVATLEQERR